jgi:hypothetical protein
MLLLLLHCCKSHKRWLQIAQKMELRLQSQEDQELSAAAFVRFATVQQEQQHQSNTQQQQHAAAAEHQEDTKALHQQLPSSLVYYKTNTLQPYLRKGFLQRAYWKGGVSPGLTVWEFVCCIWGFSLHPLCRKLFGRGGVVIAVFQERKTTFWYESTVWATSLGEIVTYRGFLLLTWKTTFWYEVVV